MEHEEIETEEEIALRRQIDKEKFIYKESFEKLRELKPKIEHIKKTIEKCRGTMMKQYDQWYNYLHSKPFAVASSSSNTGNNSNNDNYIDNNSSSNTSHEVFSKSSNSSLGTIPSESSHTGGGYTSYTGPAGALRTGGPANGGGGCNTVWDNNNNRRLPPQQQQQTGSNMSGSSLGMSDVDDDVEAFYKAKDQLVRLQQQQQQQQQYEYDAKRR